MGEARAPSDATPKNSGAAMMQVSYLQEMMAKNAGARASAAVDPRSESITAHCTGQSPYILAAANRKCETVTGTYHGTESTAVCYEKCLAQEDCDYFTYSEAEGVCKLCDVGSPRLSQPQWMVYAMCTQAAQPSADVCLQPSTPFKLCSAWGDPHYSESFFGDQFDFMGVGVYKLAGTLGGSFELQAYQCPFTRHASAFAAFAWKTGDHVVSVIGDTIAVNGANISRAGHQISPLAPMPSGLDVAGSPSTGVRFQSADKCVSLKVTKKASAHSSVGHYFHQQLRVAADLAGQVGVCGDLVAHTPVAPEHALFSAEELERLCHACGLKDCEPQPDTGRPKPVVPLDFVPIAGYAEMCNQMGIAVSQAEGQCEKLGKLGEIARPYYEACMYDYCAAGGDEAMAVNAFQVYENDEAERASLVGPKSFPTPPPQPMPSYCANPKVPFELVSHKSKCATGPTRLFEAQGVASARDCLEMCIAKPGCQQFSYAVFGENQEDCLGCKASTWIEGDGFMGFQPCHLPGVQLLGLPATGAEAHVALLSSSEDGPPPSTGTCASGADYELIAQNKKCKQATPPRHFRLEGVNSLEACFEHCRTTADCAQFTYADEKNREFPKLCMGCSASDLENHAQFNTFTNCKAGSTASPAACQAGGDFKYCGAFGDPHYRSTFFGKKFDFQGLGVYMLAATIGGDFTLQGFQCPFRRRAATFAGFALKTKGTIVSIIGDTIAVNGTNISTDGQLLSDIRMPSEVHIVGTPSTGLNYFALDNCVNLHLKKRVVTSSPVGYVFDQRLRVGAAFAGMVGVCGDEADRDPLPPAETYFTGEELVRLCDACGLERCEIPPGSDKPDFTAPTDFVPVINADDACAQALITKGEAEANCSAAGVTGSLLEDCALDYCLSGGDQAVVTGAKEMLDMEVAGDALFVTDTTTAASTTAPPTTKKPASTTTTTTTSATTTVEIRDCSAGVNFVLVQDAARCSPGQAIFNEQAPAVSDCYERCLGEAGCGLFSYADSGREAWTCMGCPAGKDWSTRNGHKGYKMCTPSTGLATKCSAKEATFKLCTATGDPHYDVNFVGPSFSFQGLGIYRMAGTKDGNFELHAFHCPVSNSASAVAGLAWRSGSTLVSLINETIAVNGTNISEAGQLLDPDVPIPSEVGISLDTSKKNKRKFIYLSADDCVHLNALIRTTRRSAGWLYNTHLQIETEMVAGIGLCGDASARDPVSVEAALFTGDQMVNLCYLCGLSDCELPPDSDRPLNMAAPLSYNPAADAATACQHSGINYTEAVAACAEVPDASKEDCVFDYCATDGAMGVEEARDAAEETAALGGNAKVPRWKPSEVANGTTACSISPYHLAGLGKSCHPNQLLFERTDLSSAAACYELCARNEACVQFSFAETGLFKGMCYGCVERPWKTRYGFKAYTMCQHPPNAKADICTSTTCKFKVCSAWGDPHFTSTFFGQPATSVGLGLYKLASTHSSDFVMEGYQCPFRNHSATFAGFAWSEGGTVISIIGDTMTVNGTAIESLHLEMPLPVGFNKRLQYDKSKSTVSFETLDGCVMLRIQKVATDHSSAGYFYNQQVRIAEDFAAPEGLCGDGGFQGNVPIWETLFSGAQMVDLCERCGLKDCVPFEDGFPRASVPLGYVPVQSSTEACQMTGTNYEAAQLACAAVADNQLFLDACIHDYCAAYGDVAMAAMAKTAKMEEEALLRGTGVTPFTWSSQHATATPDSDKMYAEAVTGHCTTVLDCSQQEAQDCSALKDYTCATHSKGFADFLEDGVTLRMQFEGSVAAPAEECGEEDCDWWHNYKTCAGPYAETHAEVVMGGHCIRWEMESSTDANNTDWYEYFVGVYHADGELLDHRFVRGLFVLRGWSQIEVNTTSRVYVRVHLAAYDSNGDRDVGAAMDIRNMVHGPCLKPSQLQGPDDCVVNGNTANLTEDGYFMLAECCCEMEMNVYLQRVMEDRGFEECRTGALWGMVPYYTCVHGTQSLANIDKDFISNLDDTDCPNFALSGECPKTTSTKCPDFTGPGALPGTGTIASSAYDSGSATFNRPHCGRFG